MLHKLKICGDVDNLSCLGMFERQETSQIGWLFCEENAICRNERFEFDSVILRILESTVFLSFYFRGLENQEKGYFFIYTCMSWKSP